MSASPDGTRWTSSVPRGITAPREGMGASAWFLAAMFFAALYALYFAPALFKDALLAPGDGEIYYLPFFHLPVTELWNDLILSGYPVSLDIQAMTFYPLRWVSPSFNTLVLLAYVVAALGMFGLSLRLTGSRLGALTAALIASGSGFMLGHLGHLSIIHAAAWVPWILWALLATRSTAWRGVGLGALAVAMCIYGGHPQVSVIGLLFAGVYALFLSLCELRDTGRRAAIRYLAKAALLFLTGLIIAGPALVGLIDSAGNSVRAAWSLNDFGSFSHDFQSLRLLWFPNLYGGQAAGPYGGYTGPFNITELALYAGIGSWILALCALLAFRKQLFLWFWIVGAIGGLLLALGTATPLGDLVYHMPVLGKFRAQARFGWIFIISLSILAAYGVSAAMSVRLSGRQRIVSCGLALAALLAIVAWTFFALPDNVQAFQGGPWSYPGFWVPLAIMMASLVVFGTWLWRPSHGWMTLVLLLLVMDLASFGWFHDWRYLPASTANPSGPRYAAPPPALSRGDGRVLTLGAENWPAGTLRPNSNISAGVPVVTGYGPLLSARYAQVTGADTTGGFPRIPIDAPLMDVLGVRWVAGDIANSDPQLVGAGCGMAVPQPSVVFAVPPGVQADQVRIVSHMACSESLVDGYTAATLRVLDAGGNERAVLPVQVGRQTGEWAHDRKDLVGVVAHSRPPVADSFDAGGFLGHSYEGSWGIPGGQAVRIEMIATQGSKAPVKLLQMQVHDAVSNQWLTLEVANSRQAMAALPPLIVWKGEVPLRERVGYRSMAWVACHTRQADLPMTAALLAGREAAERIDPFTTVLTEQRLILPKACRRQATAQIVERRHGYWRIRTQTDGPGVLVVSSAYHRGWIAEMDGSSLSVIPANGILLGVPIGSGSHNIVLRFRPPAFIAAMWLCAAALLCVLALLVWDWRHARRNRTPSNERLSR